MEIFWISLGLSFGGLALIVLLGHGHHHHASVRHHHAGARSHGPKWGAWPSPQGVLSWALGFGATGIVLHWPFPAASAWVLAPAAALGAWVFERGIVRPFWTFLFGFASRPARTLESSVRAEGRAASNFDRDGHGLVALDVDGQVVQLLGRLRGEERSAGWRVRSGDRVFVREVDPRRHHCTVSLVAP